MVRPRTFVRVSNRSRVLEAVLEIGLADTLSAHPSHNGVRNLIDWIRGVDEVECCIDGS